ncbi:NYN domain-containing protein [Actinomadura flavalba]|uniref:NYN domain-containing protein n=1 Tax=Actinomadura flavalba TaxID=1120938 RepID=UPI0003704B0E|nr:NYN domain-containing protein [Actinomadura flavalba]
MDRCALFVDAGYLLADGSMAVHGTRHRETVSWDFGGLLQLLGNLARERTGIPLLRCYWYEATVEGRRAPEHEALADLPGLKLRLGRIRPGRREGVDGEIHRDLMTLARNGALADAVVVSGDEDLAQVVADAQDLGVRVTIVHVAVDGNWTISRVLRQECDDLIEIGSGHLRPYVNLLSGVESPSSATSSGASALPAGPLSNGHGANGSGGALGSLHAPSHSASHTAPPPATPITPPSPAPSPSSASSGASSYGGTSYGSSPSYGSSSYGSSTQSTVHAAPTPAPAPPAQQSTHSTGPQYLPPQPPPAAPQHSPYTGPQQIAPLPVQQQSTPTLADAVKAAHNEGQDFGESVARDAPALWLEAVLARKPRMPSDLEARLLQGSSLPIDFLLHDEVRHALRRGFWDALERSRR